MRPITLFFFLSMTSLLFQSCDTKKQELRSKSPSGTTEILVSGTKQGLDPWILSIQIKKDGKSDTRETEMYSNEITNKNILFNWVDESTCSITLVEQDGTAREFPIQLQ
jgi:hypothetical protein